MKHKILTFLTLCLLMVFFYFSSDILVAGASSDLTHRVFILHSYEAGHVCGQPQHDGVIEALKEAGFGEMKNLKIQTYFMDTKRKNNTPQLMEKQAHLALERIRFFNPDVLVSLDDNAFRTVALKLADSKIPIVFSGMNGQPEDYNKKHLFMNSRSNPGHKITGVYEKLHVVDAVKVHSKLFPGLKKIMFFVDTSPTGRAIYKQIKVEIEKEKIPCCWDIRVVKSWEEYHKEILSANQTLEVSVIYPVALLLKDYKGKTYTAPEIFAWTIRNSKKPEISLNYAFTRMGLFGGAAVDFYAMGYQAGRMVVSILEGEDPGTIPIEEAQKYALVFNLNRAKQLGIEIPPDILMAADEVVSGTQ